MKQQIYKNQTALLLDVLPNVAKEDCFAMHGGTAINLFIRDMPRVSVDIDLTYVPIEDRDTSLKKIKEALERIKADIGGRNTPIEVDHKEDIAKLLISTKEAAIKLEVNMVMRGTLEDVQPMVLCDKAQDEFEVFAEMPVVPIGQLYGGKICAALDRQHPRDLFDVRYLLDNEGFSDDIKTGFMFCLLSSDRPFHEIIRPNLIDQRDTMVNHFEGMSEDSFSYEDFEATREELIKTIHANLTSKDKEFLLSVKALAPDWDIYDFERFPAVRWKLINLQKLKDINAAKHDQQYKALADRLAG